MMRFPDDANDQILRPRWHARGRRPRRGYSLVEAVLGAFLATILGLLLAMSCATFGRPALDVDARARITQEGILAAQSIACDLGDSSPIALAVPELVCRIQLLTSIRLWAGTFRRATLWSSIFKGVTSSDVIAITYQQSGNQLVRYNSASGITTTIANYVTAFSVAANPDNTSQALIQITIAFRYFSATYTLVGVNPL